MKERDFDFNVSWRELYGFRFCSIDRLPRQATIDIYRALNVVKCFVDENELFAINAVMCVPVISDVCAVPKCSKSAR